MIEVMVYTFWAEFKSFMFKLFVIALLARALTQYMWPDIDFFALFDDICEEIAALWALHNRRAQDISVNRLGASQEPMNEIVISDDEILPKILPLRRKPERPFNPIEAAKGGYVSSDTESEEDQISNSSGEDDDIFALQKSFHRKDSKQ